MNDLVEGGCTKVCGEASNGGAAVNYVNIGSFPLCHSICDDNTFPIYIDNGATLTLNNKGGHTLKLDCIFSWWEK